MQFRCVQGAFSRKGVEGGGVQEDVMDGSMEHGDEGASLGSPVESGLGVMVHVWKLLGFASIVFLLYTFIGFWGV